MRQIVFILIICVLAGIVVMPATLKLGSYALYRPRVDFSLGSKRVFRDLELKLGLDLQGGTHLVYQADMANIPAGNIDEAIQATRDNLERRINLLGVAEPVIQTSQAGSQHRLIVELPGAKDINTALTTIGQTAQLDFREPKTASATSAADLPAGRQDFTATGLTGRDLKIAQVKFDNGKAVVGLDFTPEGARKFADLTTKNIGKTVAIFLDNQIISAPTVQTAITDGAAVITGNFTIEAAKQLALLLNAGALPVPIKIVEQRNVGATLGQESINKSILAASVGMAVVWLFMLANYGIKGLLADVALGMYLLLSIAVVKLIPITLTLAGIAGLVLSIGMAVDANILIFERIKEELRWGRPLSAALELGFHRAWNSIRDSNISSLITAGILFWFGSGSVRGFALTLIVGIGLSIFTSITITRTLLRLIYDRSRL